MDSTREHRCTRARRAARGSTPASRSASASQISGAGRRRARSLGFANSALPVRRPVPRLRPRQHDAARRRRADRRSSPTRELAVHVAEPDASRRPRAMNITVQATGPLGLPTSTLTCARRLLRGLGSGGTVVRRRACRSASPASPARSRSSASTRDARWCSRAPRCSRRTDRQRRRRVLDAGRAHRLRLRPDVRRRHAAWAATASSSAT